MLKEVNEAKEFLIKKFGSIEKVTPGVYAIPTETSKGKAFMRVEITADMGMKDFHLFNNEELTESWYETKHKEKAEHGFGELSNEQIQQLIDNVRDKIECTEVIIITYNKNSKISSEGSYALASWGETNDDVISCREKMKQINDILYPPTLSKYGLLPFNLEEAIKHPERVRDYEGIETKEIRIFSSGDIAIMWPSGLFQTFNNTNYHNLGLTP